jgi:hypothetical protein
MCAITLFDDGSSATFSVVNFKVTTDIEQFRTGGKRNESASAEMYVMFQKTIDVLYGPFVEFDFKEKSVKLGIAGDTPSHVIEGLDVSKGLSFSISVTNDALVFDFGTKYLVQAPNLRYSTLIGFNSLFFLQNSYKCATDDGTYCLTPSGSYDVFVDEASYEQH